MDRLGLSGAVGPHGSERAVCAEWFYNTFEVMRYRTVGRYK